MKQFTALTFLLIASIASAATQHKVTYTESLYKATSKVHDVAGTSEADAHAKCKAEAGAQTVAATYSCKTPVMTDVVTIVPDPPAPPPPPATLLQFTATYPTAYKPLQGATISGRVNVALSDCNVTGYWTFVLDGKDINSEGGCPFEFLGDGMYWDSTTVANGSHTVQASGTTTLTAAFTVANTTPAPPVIPVPPVPGIGTAALRWTIPPNNTDGTPYTDAFGYVINYGTSPDLPLSIDVNDPKATTYLVTGLGTGTYYFCVSARNLSNVRSACSPVVSKAL